MNLEISVYQDGSNQPEGLSEILAAWRQVWSREYGQNATLRFAGTINVKELTAQSDLPTKLKKIAAIRNPDIYFVETSNNIELGGVEITTHSPDGSNVEKRYPYLWASRREIVSAFVACPYQKTRASGQKNRLPHRHSKRNLVFARDWDPSGDGADAVYQIVPVQQLQGKSLAGVRDKIRALMLRWEDLGAFFAHTLASRTLPESGRSAARNQLKAFRKKLIGLAQACVDDTTDTEASSLVKLTDGRWVQVYNSRPDSGHWERGEGQFDSIDGRLMFTLDEISLLPEDERPECLEFWLPQMVSRHPWVLEQVDREYGSKRFRNIIEILKESCRTKFADQLTDADWQILTENPGLLIEREDWRPGVYKVTDLVPVEARKRVARHGLKSPSSKLLESLGALLGDDSLYFSTHRAYKEGWFDSLRDVLTSLPASAVVLVPRIPRRLLERLGSISCKIVCAEDCTKDHLLLLRQLHRVGYWKKS